MRQIGSCRPWVAENPSARFEEDICDPARVAAALLSLLAFPTQHGRMKAASVSGCPDYGDMAATPLNAGDFHLPTIYYHTSVSAGGNVAVARQVHRGNITANFTGGVNANLDAEGRSLYERSPAYTFNPRCWAARPMCFSVGSLTDEPRVPGRRHSQQEHD